MEQQNTFLLEAPLGKLMRGYAVPCIISLLTAALYNVVDQIFIGWGVGAAGNSATNIVFPLTVLALVLFQEFPVQLISIFGTDNSPLYFDFAKLAFRMYLCMMILDCVNKAAFIFRNPWASLWSPRCFPFCGRWCCPSPWRSSCPGRLPGSGER